MAACGASGKTAALLKMSLGGWPVPQKRHYRLRAEVGTWVVSVDSPKCIASVFGVLTTTCDTVPQTVGATPFLGTSDPNAPPDNITIDTSDGNTELPCP
jgi:hypothetical protein